MNMKKQTGMSLMGTLLSLVIASAALVPLTQAFFKWTDNQQSRSHAEDVETLINQIQRYQYYKTSNNLAASPVLAWPTSLVALVNDYNSEFWSNCSTIESQQGFCKRPGYTPYGGSISYQVIDGTSAKLTIPTGMTGDKKRTWSTPLLRIPFSKVLANGDVEIKIAPPMQSLVYDGFVQRDGSTPLTGTWDLGGDYGITNAAGMSIRDTDGSQMIVGGTMSVETIQSDTMVKKPSCPDFLEPAIQAMPIGMYGSSKASPLIGNYRTLIQEWSSYWTVKLEYAAKQDSGNDFELRSAGDVAVTTYCLPKK
ncbi:type II secretion system protein [Shewanella colwelliana]|uniref:type II secretion system protein n=1 Tax=Shewanella colwelliana TaxID=23 RepID=UPI003734E413